MKNNISKEKKELGYNPSLRKFLNEKKDITVMGLWWAGYWRLQLGICAFYLAIILIAMLID